MGLMLIWEPKLKKELALSQKLAQTLVLLHQQLTITKIKTKANLNKSC